MERRQLTSGRLHRLVRLFYICVLLNSDSLTFNNTCYLLMIRSVSSFLVLSCSSKPTRDVRGVCVMSFLAVNMTLIRNIVCSLKRPVPYPFILYIFTTRYPCENDKRRLRSHGTGRKRSGSASVHMGPFGTGPDRFQTVPCSPFLEGPEMFSHPEKQSKLSNLIIRGSEENLAFRVRKLFETFEKGTPTTCSCAINTQLCIQSFSMLFGHLTTPFTLQMHSQLFLSPLQRPLLICAALTVKASWP